MELFIDEAQVMQMEPQQQTRSGFLARLFGGLNMSWPAVIIMAVGAAVLTTVFLVVPLFKGTSFERMGVHLEAWFVFAMIIMTNCKTPLESALKTFVFFLVSQPLIYLFQVPFSWLGWQIFMYYKTWFIWTLFTFPAAFVGWYIGKRNWLSVLILAPVLAFMAYTIFQAGTECLARFPHLLVCVLFCLAQIIVYVLAFMPDWKQKVAGFLIPVITVAVLAFAVPQVRLTVIQPLPGEPSFSAEATVTVGDASVADVQLDSPESGVVRISAHKYGKTGVYITDASETLYYDLEVFDDSGVDRVEITQP